ncbi:DUF4407 domain-containing protein [Mycobacterium sp. ITM-2016-00318]|uniref:DUF4407 domain-containing protein n=1 Tax=Mycobacterium sp. ITM-2016-00318 TaxID=2099693 RepID=UPI0013048E70|nr:DUF4407 domain-containing protein [Mycobacterium sp. ITM-2016-00318]WNG93626.1 DUF4407 domain-containing protein [Mycobacterium sp. ITM-2016-00318]
MSANRFGAVVAWPRALAYAIAAVVMGVVVGEVVAMLVFAGSSERRLDEQAARTASSAPAVVAASADLERTRQARSALDDAVVDASRRRDEALVVARCEFNPSPACPPTRITGLPGAGPENRTANGFLAETQRRLDKAVVEHDRLAPSLDATIADEQHKLLDARDAATATADRGFGVRWLAMNSYTLDSAGATVLRALLTGLFIVAFLFPLLLRLSRAKTTEDRRTAARATQERADLEADTAIAVKRAEVRAAIETMKAEQELSTARLQIEAQNEIDREQQRRRVAAAIEAPVHVTAVRVDEPAAELTGEVLDEPKNLPAVASDGEKRALIPTVPDVAKAATRWIRPFVPPIVASAIDTTTRPLRAARQVFEETEEIHLTLRRSHRVSVTSEETAESDEHWVEATPVTRTTSSRIDQPQVDTQIQDNGGRRQLPSAD